MSPKIRFAMGSLFLLSGLAFAAAPVLAADPPPAPDKALCGHAKCHPNGVIHPAIASTDQKTCGHGGCHTPGNDGKPLKEKTNCAHVECHTPHGGSEKAPAK